MPNKNENEKLSGAEEYIAEEIEFAQPIGPHEEQAIRDAVGKTEGLRADSLGLDECKVTVYYDPTRITRDEVTKLISQAGAKPNDVHTERAPLL
jgi:hypothetical protein